MADRTILLVDDEPELLELIATVLSEEKYNVGTALNAAQALTYIEANRPDLVICDVKMPNQTGFDLMAEVHAKGYSIPFIFMSGSDRQAHLSQALRLGAGDYLVKPFNFDMLLGTIKAELELKKKWDLILAMIQNHNEDLCKQIKDELTKLAKYRIYKNKKRVQNIWL